MKTGDKVYRNVINRKSNEWNDEPEYISIPYEIINETKKAFLVVRCGWGKGKKQQHHLPKIEFYPSRELAQKALLISKLSDSIVNKEVEV